MIGKKSLSRVMGYGLWVMGLLLFFIKHPTPNTQHLCYAQEAQKEGPVTVNGDVVEYSTTGREISATGNALIDYKGAKLTCDKITVNTETKEGVALGNVRLEDKKGVIEGDKATYNFNTKAGIIDNAEFRSTPFFGRARNVQKINDAEFIAHNGYMATCSFDDPHYRIKAKKIDFYPDDKVKIKNTSVYIGKSPVMFLPSYTHSLKDPLMHVQLMPGKKKDWGPFMLSAWRYSLNDNAKGRIYFDYRQKLGVAEGLGLNYDTKKFGKGDYKYYYTQERSRKFDEGVPAEFQRYFIRLRHKWDIDQRTNLLAEYYEITDSKQALHGSVHSILKDYFFREYEKDTQPPSYLSYHRAFSYSSLDFFMQKRVNRWYNRGYLEKLPEIKYTLPSSEIAESPFYFESVSAAGNFNKKNTSTSTPAANAANPDVHFNRLDTTNKFSLPTKVSFIEFSPFVGSNQTFYDKDINSDLPSPRTVFLSGANLSTKFYRIFNVKPDFLRMDIRGLRHVITPTVGYSYNHEPTISNNKLRQIDGIDSLSRSNRASLGLLNKLQAKRGNATVDFLTFNTSTNYIFKPKGQAKTGSNFSDVSFDLEFLPYSWIRLDADASYQHSGDRFAEGYNRFSMVNYDLNFDLGNQRTIGLGQRYQRQGNNEITQSLNWRLSPKWEFSFYQRRNIGRDPTRKRGLREQEYSIRRDLHCWTVSVVYNVKRAEGEAIWLTFTLKAFPELEFGFDQNYHQPKSGTQSNPVDLR